MYMCVDGVICVYVPVEWVITFEANFPISKENIQV